MATRLYLHNATSANTGTLPSTKQSAKTTQASIDAVTVNRSMNITIGTSQLTVSGTPNTGSTIGDAYVTRFLSSPISSNLTAQTWTINIAAASNSGAWSWMDSASSGSNGGFRVCAFVWRPSTGAKVANIFDGVTSAIDNNQVLGSFTEKVFHVTISGSAVTVTAGDIIGIEFFCGQYGFTSATETLYMDGTTVNTSTAYPSATSHAAFIETPDTISFSGAGVTATPTSTVITNKFIAHG
jgi:hypothetical protein